MIQLADAVVRTEPPPTAKAKDHFMRRIGKALHVLTSDQPR